MGKDTYKNERIKLALEKVKDAKQIEDVALIVSQEGLPLLTTMLEHAMHRIVREELEKAIKEFSNGLLQGMMERATPNEDRGPTEIFAPRINPEEYSWKEEDWNNFYTNPIEKLSEYVPIESLAKPEEESEEGIPLWKLRKRQGKLAEKQKEKVGRRRTRYTDEEKENVKQQFNELKKKFPGKKDNWYLERVELPGRSKQAVSNLFHRTLKGEMNS